MAQRPFIVGLLATMLVLNPWAATICSADPTSLTPAEEAAVAQVQSLAARRAFMSEFFTEAVEGLVGDPGEPGCSCAFDLAEGTLAEMWPAVFGRSWAVGEITLRAEAPATIAGQTTLYNLDDDMVTATLLSVSNTWNLADKSDSGRQYIDGVIDFANLYSNAARVTLLVTSSSGSALIDALEVYRIGLSGYESNYIVMSAGVDGSAPPSTTASHPPQCYWHVGLISLTVFGCGFFGTLCFGGGLIACGLAYASCCQAFDEFMNVNQWCGGWIPAPGSNASGFIHTVNVACTIF